MQLFSIRLSVYVVYNFAFAKQKVIDRVDAIDVMILIV